MNTVVRIKKRHALVGLMVGCSVAGFLFGFTAHAETVNGDREDIFLCQTM